MYWQNHRSSTIEVKPKYELDDGTPWTGMERVMGRDAAMPLVAAPRGPHVTGGRGGQPDPFGQKGFLIIPNEQGFYLIVTWNGALAAAS